VGQLESSADIEAMDSHDQTLLSLAAEREHEAVVKLLLLSGIS
jgi:ankyrin repeat protein